MSTGTSDSRRFLPIALNVQGAECLIVGGGKVGARKVFTLARAGAKVTVVSPGVTDELAGEIKAGRVKWVEGEFREEHLDGAFLVVAATDDKVLNTKVISVAGERGALVCDASSAERSQVIFGALLDHGDATVAVFTDGRDPAHSRKTRDRIAALFDKEDKREE